MPSFPSAPGNYLPSQTDAFGWGNAYGQPGWGANDYSYYDQQSNPYWPDFYGASDNPGVFQMPSYAQPPNPTIIGSPDMQIGYPGSDYQIPVNTPSEGLGSYGSIIAPPANTGTTPGFEGIGLPPDMSGGDSGFGYPAGHGSLGSNNPTVYGGNSGLLGSGLDIGIPGLISVGGLLGAGGGLIGLGGGNIFGGGGGGGAPAVDTTPDTTIIPPIADTGPKPAATIPTPPIAINPGTPSDSGPVTTIGPIGGGASQGGSGPTWPAPIGKIDLGGGIYGDDPNYRPPVTVPPIVTPTPGGPTTVPRNPGELNGPITLPPIISPIDHSNVPGTTPIVPITPVTPVNPANPVNPVTPIVPTPVPTPTTMPALPIDRNYYREGNQTSNDFGALGPGIFGNYAQYSGLYGNQDLANYGANIGTIGGYNNQLTGYANQQTGAANTALRTGNVADASTLGPQALATLKQLNPGLYASLTQASTAAGTAGQPSDIQTTLEAQARAGLGLGTQLSDEDLRNAQQSAREAWSARGLVNSNGAIGAEILNRDALGRQRLLERQNLAANVDQAGFNQRQQGFGNVLQNAQLQGMTAFNPFQQITNANTTNQGSNQALFGQGAGFSSGSFGNQNVNQLVNPFNSYSQDVYSTNYNAGNDRYIAAGNNAAGLAAGQTQSNSAMAQAFIRALGGYLGGVCWVAREVYTPKNPKWLMFRYWLLTRAPRWFKTLYVEHGERFAAWLRLNPWAKPPIRAFMDGRIKNLQLPPFPYA